MKKIKQILSMLLVVCCVVTMIPSTVFASFETNSGKTTDVGGPSGNKLVNLVNVGYRISLYYAGKESNNKRYMAPIAYNESGNKPLMMKFSSMFDSEDYNASKSKSDKVSATYFRDLAATKASILVLNSKGNSFGTIYQLKPTTDYKNTKMTWDEVDDKRICKKDSSNAVYKWINKYTNNALSKFQSKSWLGTRKGASAIVDSTALDGIDKEFSKRKLTAKKELVKAFKPYTTVNSIKKYLLDFFEID